MRDYRNLPKRAGLHAQESVLSRLLVLVLVLIPLPLPLPLLFPNSSTPIGVAALKATAALASRTFPSPL